SPRSQIPARAVGPQFAAGGRDLRPLEQLPSGVEVAPTRPLREGSRRCAGEPLLAALRRVFVAEVGDHTQLVALGLGARHRLAPVLAGVAAAYMAAVLLSVAAGGLLGAALPTRALGLGGGVLFLGFAAWTLRPDPEPEEQESAPAA